ncbi:exonuclease sbcD, putative [Thermoproteus uzoniensis 768-20]|uniref:Exonuclease sbcD, putative n=1 Tax=Thermoproteus uzoniensis (strain 768-20) TaxID=999630 RepID=F2L505_THEU7|nr:DNA repair exonuclease [Thermoproteus uzoniensis]AEA12254.1 exonuclease sbcD, putative [Thermoproteus uzoniensis 768-20]
MKIAHISDAHLGRQQYHLPEREEDYFQAFAEALRLAKGADAVVVTGDLLDTRRPSTRTLLRLLDILGETGLALYVVGGNHDYSHLRPDETPLRILDKVGAARLLCFQEADLGGVWLYGACATPRSKADEYRERILSARPGSVLAIHQAIEGVKARYPSAADEYTMPSRAFSGVKAVHIAAGHVHDHGVRHLVGALWAGSLEIWDSAEFETWDWRKGKWELYQEAAPKGFYIIDVAGRAASAKEVLLRPRRRMVKLRVFLDEEREAEAAFEEAAARFDAPGAVVKVELYGDVRGDLRPSRHAAAFSRALYVDVVDRTRKPSHAVARVGSAYEAVERLLRERLGAGADAVVKALAHARDGDRAAARKIMEEWLYAEVDRA